MTIWYNSNKCKTQIVMFGILGACWGGSTDSNAEFERAKLVCTSADWKSPDH